MLWNPGKAKVSEEDVQTKGYAGRKDAYKGYVGQKVGDEFFAGLKPDKINKSGRVEIKSAFLARARSPETRSRRFSASSWLRSLVLCPGYIVG